MTNSVKHRVTSFDDINKTSSEQILLSLIYIILTLKYKSDLNIAQVKGLVVKEIDNLYTFIQSEIDTSKNFPDIAPQINTVIDLLIKHGAKPSFYDEHIDLDNMTTLLSLIVLLKTQNDKRLVYLGERLWKFRERYLDPEYQKYIKKGKQYNQILQGKLRDSEVGQKMDTFLPLDNGAQFVFGYSQGYCFAISYFLTSKIREEGHAFVENLKTRHDKIKLVSDIYDSIYPNYELPLVPINKDITFLQQNIEFVRNNKFKKKPDSQSLEGEDINQTNIEQYVLNTLSHIKEANDNKLYAFSWFGDYESNRVGHEMGVYYNSDDNKFYFVDPDTGMVVSDNIEDMAEYITQIYLLYEEFVKIDRVTSVEYENVVSLDDMYILSEKDRENVRGVKYDESAFSEDSDLSLFSFPNLIGESSNTPSPTSNRDGFKAKTAQDDLILKQREMRREIAQFKNSEPNQNNTANFFHHP